MSLWFWGVVIYLISIGAMGVLWTTNEVAQPSPRRLWLALVAGMLGSCIAAFRSCLDRRANGLEDQFGNVAPGIDAKERFSDGMVVWFLGRPLLGAAIGWLIYVGLKGGVFSDAAHERILDGEVWKFLFYMIVAGLFAKTILDLLLEGAKKIFRV